MANFIRISHEAVQAIPAERWHVAHAMYEDNDLMGAEQAEKIFDFIEQEAPGTFVGILANDSVTPPCCTAQEHYNCDYYEPYWYTIFVAAHVWEQYKGEVEARDRAWKAAHGCQEKNQEEGARDNPTERS